MEEIEENIYVDIGLHQHFQIPIRSGLLSHTLEPLAREIVQAFYWHYE